jgi:threonine synthase
MMKDLGIIDRLPRLVCAQAERANPLYLSYLKNFEDYRPIQAQKTLANAIQIGDPVSIHRAIKTLKAFNGVVEQATENELADAAARADRSGLFNCPHTGVALAALMKLVKKGVIKTDEKVVVISTAHGLKFPEFKIGYYRGTLKGVESRYMNRPVEVRADYDTIRTAIFEAIERGCYDLQPSPNKDLPQR